MSDNLAFEHPHCPTEETATDEDSTVLDQSSRSTSSSQSLLESSSASGTKATSNRSGGSFLFAPEGIQNDADISFPVLQSTHLVFFKITDYIDFGLTEGSQKKFLFIFRSIESFFDFSLALFILVAQVIVMLSLTHETKGECKSERPPHNMWMGVILCALHAANVGLVAFLKALPYELVGTNPKKVELLLRKVNESRRHGKDLFSAVSYNISSKPILPPQTHQSHSSAPSPARSSEEPSQHSASAQDVSPGGDEETGDDELTWFCGANGGASYLSTSSHSFLRDAWGYVVRGLSYGYLYGVVVILQINNLLLLFVVASVLATATTFRELVTSFISVELITHVHEVVPMALKLRDKSPAKFNKSGLELETELEVSRQLPFGVLVPPRLDGSGGVYRMSARMHKNIVYWFFFLVVCILYFIVSSECRRQREKFLAE